MFWIDTAILVSGILLLLGIISSKFSARFGVPVLVLFLGLGMLAGSEGLGGIAFDNYATAHAIGSVALAFILFDGGLSTPLEGIRAVWRPAAVLATLGVLLTALITGGIAAWILKLPLSYGLLLGSIVSSTDAAAVFAMLRSGGVSLPARLQSTLEVESGSNDPMAIFLTVGLLQIMTGGLEPGPDVARLFFQQMVIGGLVGLGGGYLTTAACNRINLDIGGLYPVLASACAMFTFGVAARYGGSGFLAVYVAGIVIGNSRLVFKRGTLLFHNAAAWLSQIAMFVVLGLLSFPSRFWAVAPEGLGITFVLCFVARPIAVFLCLLPFRFNWRELLFLSWVGLKGAVPITLATFPLLYDIPNAGLLFNVVFFVVVVSALVQGWTLPIVARKLKLALPLRPPPPVSLEISSLRHMEGDIVDYTVVDDSRAAGKAVNELALPEGVVIALVARNGGLIPPQGRTRIEKGDHVVVVLRPDVRPLVDHIFAREVAPVEIPQSVEFPLRASISVGELQELYGFDLESSASATLSEAVRLKLAPRTPAAGEIVRFREVSFRIRELAADQTIVSLGMILDGQGSPGPTG